MRIPPASAAEATPRIIELLGDPPARILELGFGGIHAEPLRLSDVRAEIPRTHFDAVVAPEGTDLRGIDAERRVIVYADGSILG